MRGARVATPLRSLCSRWTISNNTADRTSTVEASNVLNVLKHCPDVNNKSNRSAFYVAVHAFGRENCNIVKKLLQCGITAGPEDVNNCKLLHAAVEDAYLKTVKELLKYGTDVNKLYKPACGRGYIPLHVAAKNKQQEVAKLIKQSIARGLAGVDAMRFLPSTLNMKVKKFKQAQVNGGSNLTLKCLLIARRVSVWASSPGCNNKKTFDIPATEFGGHEPSHRRNNGAVEDTSDDSDHESRVEPDALHNIARSEIMFPVPFTPRSFSSLTGGYDVHAGKCNLCAFFVLTGLNCI